LVSHCLFSELAKQSKIKDGPVQEGPIKSSTDPDLTEKRCLKKTETVETILQMEEGESIANNGYLSPPNGKLYHNYVILDINNHPRFSPKLVTFMS
jgi:hypothetical protein